MSPDPRELASTRAAYADLRLQEKLAYDLPWSHATERGCTPSQGFIETESALVLVAGGYAGRPSALTVVEIGAQALSRSGTVNFGGETLPRAAMAVVGQRLALFQNTPGGLALQVHPLASPAA